MATPIAHACVGLACLALVRVLAPRSLPRPLPWQALACAFAACTPDLDILLSLIFTGSTTAWHSGPTHTLGFAALVGLSVWLALGTRNPSRSALAWAVGLATASHVLVDFLTGPQVGWYRSFGVPALWPWIAERLTSPFTLFRGVRHGGIAIWFTAHNMTTAAIELTFGVPLALLSLWLLKRRGTAPPMSTR